MVLSSLLVVERLLVALVVLLLLLLLRLLHLVGRKVSITRSSSQSIT